MAFALQWGSLCLNAGPSENVGPHVRRRGRHAEFGSVAGVAARREARPGPHLPGRPAELARARQGPGPGQGRPRRRRRAGPPGPQGDELPPLDVRGGAAAAPDRRRQGGRAHRRRGSARHGPVRQGRAFTRAEHEEPSHETVARDRRTRAGEAALGAHGEAAAGGPGLAVARGASDAGLRRRRAIGRRPRGEREPARARGRRRDAMRRARSIVPGRRARTLRRGTVALAGP